MAAPIAQCRPLRILLVEDNPQVAEVAVAIMSEQGHTIIHAETADEALGMLHSGLTFDLAFADLVMPGKHDGLSLALIIRRKWPALPICWRVATARLPTGRPKRALFSFRSPTNLMP